MGECSRELREDDESGASTRTALQDKNRNQILMKRS